MTNLMKMVDGLSVEMTDEEQSEFLAQQALDITNISVQQIRQRALSALSESDRVATRCVKSSIPYPAEWVSYDMTLRAIVSSGSGTFPIKPIYPVNT